MNASVRRWALCLVFILFISRAQSAERCTSESTAVFGTPKNPFKESFEGRRRDLLQSTPGTTSSGQGSITTSSPPPPGASNGPPPANATRSPPAPAPVRLRIQAPGPAPEAANSSRAPAPAPSSSSRAPAPAPARTLNAPAPSPAEDVAEAPTPAPSQQGTGTLPTAPAPGPQAQAPGQAPVPAPISASALGQVEPPAPAPAPQTTAAALLQSAPSPAPFSALASAPKAAPGSSPLLAPAPIPSPAVLGSASVPAIAPGVGTEAGLAAALASQGLSPGQEASSPAPALAPTLAPAAFAPAPTAELQMIAPAPSPTPGRSLVTPTPSPASPLPVTSLGPGPAPTVPLGVLSPFPAAQTPALPTLSSLLGLGPVTGPAANIPSSALSPQGLLAPGSPSALPLAPSLAPALALVYPAAALPPAGPGQVTTLVTLPATESGASVTQLDPTSDQIRTATPESIATGGQLFARPGALSFVVQTSAATNSLPAQAVNVQGGTVTSTSPVQGSNGSLFNVNVNTAAGASFLTIGTVAGVGLANGLLTTSSNTLRIDLMSQNPQTRITTADSYRSGSTVTPSFTIDFGGRVVEEDPRRLYTLTGATRTDVVYDYGNGRVFIMAYILPGQEGTATDIAVSVAAGVTTDPAGNPNTAASYTWEYRPKSPSYNIVSDVANGVSGAGLAVALATPVVLGTTMVGASGATVAAAGTFYMLHILYNLQYVYLAGRMNVANLPDNFRQVSDSLSWSVLNFRAPWETAKSNSVGNYQATHGFPTTPQGISTGSFGPRGSDLFSVSGRKLLEAEHTFHRHLLQAGGPASAPIGASNGTITLPNVAGGSSQYVVTSTGLNTSQTSEASSVGSISELSESVSTAALGNGNDPYETVWRSLFWLAVALVAVTVLVTAAVAFFLYKRWQLPIILQSPRPQIMLLMFGVPAIAQSSAGLFAGGDGKAIAVGVVIVCFLPFLMVLYGAFFVWRHILPNDGRRAAWVLMEDPEGVQDESSWWSRVLDVIVGPKGSEGSWMALKRRDSRFVNQYGPFFEVNRGPPMVLTDVTYEVDPETGFCNRGRLQQIYEAPIFKLGRFVLYPYHLQGQNSGVELMVAIATAILLQAFTQPSSYAQVILLICLNVLLLVWLRLIRPAGDRTELIMAMMGTLSILGIYICGLILLANPNGSDGFRNRIGIAMLVLGLWSVVTFILGVISFLITTVSLYKGVRNWIWPSKDPAQKFANAVYGVMAKDEYILARKFGDRWLYKALGSGLHGRAIHRREKVDPRKRLYKAVRQLRPKATGAKKPVRLGRAGQTGPGIGYGPSPAEKVGGMQWPGMAQVSKLKQKEKEDSALLGSPDDSPNQYLDTGDISPHDPREINASGGTSTGSGSPNGSDNPSLGIRDFLGKEKVHAAAPQAALPLGSRQNQVQSIREVTQQAVPRPEPQVVVDFETGITPASPHRGRSPDRRRQRDAESPRYFRSDDKENQ